MTAWRILGHFFIMVRPHPVSGLLYVSYVRIGFADVKYVIPSLVLYNANAMITVIGSDFVNVSSSVCLFTLANNAVLTAPSTFVNQSAVQCRTPSLYIQQVSVGVANDGLNTGTTASIWFVPPTGEVTAVSPHIVVANSISTIEVSGTSFVSTAWLACTFGVISTVATYFSSTYLECPTPVIGPSLASVPMGVANDGIHVGVTVPVYFYGMSFLMTSNIFK